MDTGRPCYFLSLYPFLLSSLPAFPLTSSSPVWSFSPPLTRCNFHSVFFIQDHVVYTIVWMGLKGLDVSVNGSLVFSALPVTTSRVSALTNCHYGLSNRPQILQVCRSYLPRVLETDRKLFVDESLLRRMFIFSRISEPSKYCQLTFRHRASSVQDRRFATLQRTFFIYLMNKYISLSDICLTVHH